MQMPWADKTGLAKAAVVFAVMLLVSLGLCGVNFVLFSKFGAISGGTPQPPRTEGGSALLMVAGFIELTGMIVGAVGIVLVGLIAVGRAIYEQFKGSE